MEILAGILGLIAVAAGGGAAWLYQQLEGTRGALDEGRTKLQSLQEAVRRSVTERDATVRRVRDQASQEKRFAAEPLLRDLVEVIDNFDRATQLMDEGAEPESVREGVQVTRDQLLQVLTRHGVVRIDPVGHPFDPAVHEAIGQAPNEDVPEGSVSNAWVAGYLLHDRLVRPAKVIVSSGPAATDEAVDDDATVEPPLDGPTDEVPDDAKPSEVITDRLPEMVGEPGDEAEVPDQVEVDETPVPVALEIAAREE
jgi:molecular chaperone GrpE